MQGLQRQQRLYYKNKVGDIISSYERQQQEQQKQKADLKKNVMLSILNSRKNATAPPTSYPQSEQESKEQKQQPIAYYPKHIEAPSQIVRPPPNIMQHQPVQEQTKQKSMLEEITFNAKKRDKSLEEELAFKESYLNLLRERRMKEDPPEDQEERAENVSRKNDSPPIQKSVYKSSHSSSEEGSEGRSSKASMLQKYSNFKQSLKQELQQSQQRNYRPEEQEKQEQEQNHKYRYQDGDEEEQPPRQEYTKYDKPKEELSYLQAFKEKYNKDRQQKQQRQRQKQRQQRELRWAQEERQREIQQQQARRRQQEQQEREQKGVFLTMEESQSMVAEDGPKNYAFEIKMDKSTDPNDLQQLKQQRIREIQRKRQERIQQFRRNQSQKKVEMPRGKNSYSKKPVNQTLNESDAPPPRSATIERKGNPPPAPKNESSKVDQRDYTRPIPIQQHDSQYSMRPPSSKHLPPNPSSYHPDPEPRPPTYKQARNNNYQADREREKPLSPFKTPKSMADPGRGKSGGKSTGIFMGQGQRERSSNKQAKIQPKDRKNSFTRQSNKKQMVNAITYVVFPGQLNRKERERLTDIIQGSPHEFFIFLFKEYSRKMIKGIYVFDGSQTALRKIYGQKSPNEITADMVQQFYKYDNGSREFKRIDGCRSFSFSINAIDLRK